MSSAGRTFNLIHAEVVTPRGTFRDGAVAVKDGVITYVGTTAGLPEAHAAGVETMDAKGSYVLPGFIDVHVHGGMLAVL